MPEIVPRWEWRTFDADLESATRMLAAPPERERESDEVYLLSAHSDASVKVRDDQVDVKELQQVDHDGLELWMPVLKSELPLPAEHAVAVLAALGVEARSLGRPAYTLEELRHELIEPNPDLRSLEVHKMRTHHTIEDCMVELSQLTAMGRSIQTIAIESPNPAHVLATVRMLGLEGRRNVSVARQLKVLAGVGGRRYGVIDVGTNSVKFHLGERQADGGWQKIVDRAEITRLGEGLDESGRLADDAVARTADAIAGMVDEARREGALAVVAVGTAGLRLATNREALDDAVRSRSGQEIEVISGEEEGRLAYLAATSALPVARGRLVVFDSGGGSSQFSFGQAGQVEERFSVNVGAVRFAERYGLAAAVSEEVLRQALDAIDADLGALDGRTPPDSVVAMGGTATNLAAVKHGLEAYDPDVVHGTVLNLAEIDRQIELYRTHDVEQRRSIAGLQPKRAEVILAGACIVRTILTKLQNDALTVSDRGLRHGLFVERFTP